MKELSIEEKAKAYDEVLERAREEYEIYKGIKDVYHCEALERIFRKLSESEDERIRKELLNYLYDVHDDDEERARWISYLEKQGKYKQVEVRPFNTVFSQEQIDEIDKRIEKEIKLYNAKLMDAQMRAKDFPMTD